MAITATVVQLRQLTAELQKIHQLEEAVRRQTMLDADNIAKEHDEKAHQNAKPNFLRLDARERWSTKDNAIKQFLAAYAAAQKLLAQDKANVSIQQTTDNSPEQSHEPTEDANKEPVTRPAPTVNATTSAASTATSAASTATSAASKEVPAASTAAPAASTAAPAASKEAPTANTAAPAANTAAPTANTAVPAANTAAPAASTATPAASTATSAKSTAAPAASTAAPTASTAAPTATAAAPTATAAASTVTAAASTVTAAASTVTAAASTASTATPAAGKETSPVSPELVASPESTAPELTKAQEFLKANVFNEISAEDNKPAKQRAQLERMVAIAKSEENSDDYTTFLLLDNAEQRASLRTVAREIEKFCIQWDKLKKKGADQAELDMALDNTVQFCTGTMTAEAYHAKATAISSKHNLATKILGGIMLGIALTAIAAGIVFFPPLAAIAAAYIGATATATAIGFGGLTGVGAVTGAFGLFGSGKKEGKKLQELQKKCVFSPNETISNDQETPAPIQNESAAACCR